MPDAPRSDRLSRAELEQLQRKCLRDWKESDWFATHDPRGWTALQDKDPTKICVDLGAGVGEAQQYPGYIALDKVAGDRRELQARGEEKLTDLLWNLNDGLPFEDQSVDDAYLRDVFGELEDHAKQRLPKELARVMAAGGRVTLRENDAGALGALLEPFGFDEEEPGVWVLTAQKRPMEEMQPHLYQEHVLGTPMIREVRMPYRR